MKHATLNYYNIIIVYRKLSVTQVPTFLRSRRIGNAALFVPGGGSKVEIRLTRKPSSRGEDGKDVLSSTLRRYIPRQSLLSRQS